MILVKSGGRQNLQMADLEVKPNGPILELKITSRKNGELIVIQIQNPVEIAKIHRNAARYMAAAEAVEAKV